MEEKNKELWILRRGNDHKECRKIRKSLINEVTFVLSPRIWVRFQRGWVGVRGWGRRVNRELLKAAN